MVRDRWQDMEYVMLLHRLGALDDLAFEVLFECEGWPDKGGFTLDVEEDGDEDGIQRFTTVGWTEYPAWRDNIVLEFRDVDPLELTESLVEDYARENEDYRATELSMMLPSWRTL